MIKSLIITASLISGGAGPVVTPPPAPPATSFSLPAGQQAKGFIRYIPDKQGDMTWELQGDFARLLSPTQTEITGLTAISHDRKVGDLKLTVDKFIYDSKAREGRADKERVAVRRGNMVLTGKGIRWWADQKYLRILEDVKLLVNEKDQGGFFPFDLPTIAPGKAEPRPGSTPAEDWTVITCDGNLFMNYLKNTITFYRNVLVKNPRGKMRSDQMVVFVSPADKKVDKVEAFGNIDIKMGERRGSSDKALYLPGEKKVILLGNARIMDEKNQVNGEKITFYIDRKEMEVSSVSDIKLIPEEDMTGDLFD